MAARRAGRRRSLYASSKTRAHHFGFVRIPRIEKFRSFIRSMLTPRLSATYVMPTSNTPCRSTSNKSIVIPCDLWIEMPHAYASRLLSVQTSFNGNCDRRATVLSPSSITNSFRSMGCKISPAEVKKRITGISCSD